MLQSIYKASTNIPSSIFKSCFSIFDQPKMMKFPKLFKGRVKLHAKQVNLAFGKYGLQSLETARITAKQIDATRKAMAPHVKKGGQVWIRIFPDIPCTKKPAEVRMGKGKGSVELYVARVPEGTIMYEIEMPDDALALKALKQCANKLPVRTRIIKREPGDNNILPLMV